MLLYSTVKEQGRGKTSACTYALWMFSRCQITMKEKLTLLSIPFRTSGSHSITPYLFTTCCLQEDKKKGKKLKEWEVIQTEILESNPLSSRKLPHNDMMLPMIRLMYILPQHYEIFIVLWGRYHHRQRNGDAANYKIFIH